ncbi:hypothetical protein L9F63_014805, partial [Diploptera punctata]
MEKEKFNNSVKYLYLVFWILLSSVTGCYVSKVSIDLFKERPAKLGISVTFSLIIMFVGNVISLINSIVKRNNFPKIMNTFWKVDNRLLTRSCADLYDKEKWCSIKYIITVSLLYAAIVNSLFWAFHEATVSNFIFDTFQNLPIFVSGILSIQFISLVKKLRKSLREINKLLGSYRKHKTVSITWKTPRRIINFLEDISAESVTLINNKFLNISKLHKTNLLNSKTSRRSIQFVDDTSAVPVIRLSEDVQLIQNIYIDLYEAKELINTTYGIPIILQVLNCYSLSVMTVIEGIDALTRKTDELTVVFDICLLTYVFVMLAWILLNCHQVSGESAKIISNVQKLMVRCDVPQDVRRDLNTFLYIMRDLPLQFTPSGLFTLNLSFLCNTVGLICTYVVVMLQ